MRNWVLICCCAAVLTPVVADAHSTATATDPRNGAVLTTAPQNFTFKFHEASRLLQLSVQKIGDPAARDLKPLPKEPGKTFSIKAPLLGPGQYVVRYRAMGPDGHIVPGTINFTIDSTGKTSVAQPNH